MEYEREGNGSVKLDTFFNSSVPRIRTVEVRGWTAALMLERKEFWRQVQDIQGEHDSAKREMIDDR